MAVGSVGNLKLTSVTRVGCASLAVIFGKKNLFRLASRLGRILKLIERVEF